MSVEHKISVILKEMRQISRENKGLSCLKKLAVLAAKSLDVQYVLIGQPFQSGKSIKTIVTVSGDELIDNIDYELLGTPCENVFKQGDICIYADGVADNFPQDFLLKQMNVRSYIGDNIFDDEAKLLGIFVALDTKPLKMVEQAKAIAELFSFRCGLELQRMREAKKEAGKEGSAVSKKESQLSHALELLEGEKALLEEAIRSKHALLSMVVHDMANPLMAASTNISLSPSLETDRYIQNAEDSIAEIIALTNDLRKCYKEANMDDNGLVRYNLGRSHLSVKDLVSYSRMIFSLRLKEKGISLIVTEGEDLVFLTNPSSFKNSVFNNFISNAIKFSPNGGRIEITAKDDAKGISLSIRDFGSGIPQEVLQSLNNGDLCLGSSLGTSGEEGTGLGLRSAFDSIRELGGSVQFFNHTGVASGTQINIFLKN